MAGIPPQFAKKNKRRVIDSKAEDAAEGPEDGKPDREDIREGEDFKTGKKLSPQAAKAQAKRAMLLRMAKGA